MGRYLWIFHPATVEFDFKDFIETVIPNLGECFALAAAFGRYNCQVLFWGSKVGIEEGTDNSHWYEAARISLVCQDPAKVTTDDLDSRSEVRHVSQIRCLDFGPVDGFPGLDGDSRFACQAMSAGDCNSSSFGDCNSGSSGDCNSGSSGDCNSSSSGSKEYHPADPWCWCFLAI